MNKYHRIFLARGFTLMEVMVALFILSIVSIVAVSGLSAILRAESKQVAVAHQLQDLQMTYAWLTQDLDMRVNRNVISAAGQRLPALMFERDPELRYVNIPGNILLAVTRGGIIEPANKSSLQRVAYTLQDNALMRYTWPVLDAVSSTQPKAQQILPNVSRIEMRYLTELGVYLNNWQDYVGAASLPLAVEWKITDKDGQQITWLIPIIGAHSDHEAAAETTTTNNTSTTQ